MTHEEMIRLLDDISGNLEKLSENAFLQILKLIDKGYSPREARIAVEDALKKLNDERTALIVKGFEAIMGAAIAGEYVKNLKIGGLTLSKKLYQNKEDVSRLAQKIINDALKERKTLQQIARKLYDGYDFQDDPLKIAPKIPKYLREDIMKASTRRARKLKTPALRAAYVKLIEDAQKKEVSKQLRAVVYEKGRYYANRIAQTELFRAHSEAVARKMMQDEKLEVVRIDMSSTHRIVDICDYHSGTNQYGLGKGCYPKELAPIPPFHPFCRCKLSPVYTKSAKNARYDKNAGVKFIERLPESKRRSVLGNESRVNYFMKKKPDLVAMLDKKKEYKTKRLGEI